MRLIPPVRTLDIDWDALEVSLNDTAHQLNQLNISLEEKGLRVIADDLPPLRQILPLCRLDF